MAQTRMSSVVFVGGDFPPTVFDERTLFGGRLDAEQLRIGPVGQFSYASGGYRFEVGPGRIDLKDTGLAVFSDELLDAAVTVARMVEPMRRAIPIMGLGFNCDSTFSPKDIGASGKDYCSRLVSDGVSTLIGHEDSLSAIRVNFKVGPIVYTVRMEPHMQTEERDLFVAINGHQNVSLDDPSLDKMLDRVREVRAYVNGIYDRLTENAESLST